MPDNLALTRPDPTLTMDTLRAQMEAAKRFVDSGLLPAAIKTPQQALTIMQAGREIGVPPTYALRNIHVIEGKPSCSAELLMALVRRTYGQAAIRVAVTTNELCTVEYREQGWDGISSLTFSLDDAKKAGLATKAMWGKYPRAMLRSRAVSETVRTAFPECIAGLYTPEELGADVTVTADGSVEIAQGIATPTIKTVEGEVVDSPKAAPPTSGTPADADDFARMREERKAGQQPTAETVDRTECEAEYTRLAETAIRRGHKDAKKIQAKKATDLDDGALLGSVRALAAWEAKLPAEEAPAGDPDSLDCEVCGEALTETRFKDGSNWAPAQLAVYGRRKHSRILCIRDYRAANEARRKAEEALQQVPF